MEKVNILTSTVDYAFKITETECKAGMPDAYIHYGVVCTLPIGFDSIDMEYCKDLIILYRQLEVLLR